MSTDFDIIVVGGGHAGAEAAWAGANLGARVALVTLDPATIGVMSCNPAIGGLAKGQIVREIDAMGGLMGLAADATGIMFKTLNTSRGPAVWGPRCQSDKHDYAGFIRRAIASRDSIEVIAGACAGFLIENDRVLGIRVERDRERFGVRAGAVVLTTGTFMRGLLHTGDSTTPGGRIGEAPADSISGALRESGFELHRLKTGTPPRLDRRTIKWDELEPQLGDAAPTPFSDLTDRAAFPALPQVECRITQTNADIHDVIRANLHRAPIFNGAIESRGPRYCPSIEDKVVRFAQRESHHVFLEPESLSDDSIYCNGISTSLPRDVQERLVRGMPGCEEAAVLRYGYAVEYDAVRSHQIDCVGMTGRVRGLFLAGQINGTTGYEEAAGQGLIAGYSAVRFARGEPARALSRDEAYLGVMMDDLVTKPLTEPYRMFTSRAEHRLILRADNSPDRLTPIAEGLGLLCDDRRAAFENRRTSLQEIESRIDPALARAIVQSDFTHEDMARALPDFDPGVRLTAMAERQYLGYIERQRAEIKRQSEHERRRIPEGFDFAQVTGLRAEAMERLAKHRPVSLGQAGRLEGVNPTDVTLLAIAMRNCIASC
ncbi:MAG: tRNA uridine-5-carboxymethylaminomethyl(34) synthesis enzyme MnmG [Phycisphaeraceae bacterium]|nr:tRNA uridine-5-carboxymethylaminomethyl(34) synthesis enzyme MnmG [Phycisphaeraceae bacterium]